MPRTPSINLARGRSQSFIDRFLNWALSIGRVIVIVTEFIALLVFLMRFDLDRQIIDLHSKINQEQIIVKLLNKNETTFRNLQDRLKNINTLEKQAPQQALILHDIFSLVPAAVNIDQISFESGIIQIEATTQNPQTITSFLKALRTYPQLTGVAVDKVENKTSTATIVIGITAKIKKT